MPSLNFGIGRLCDRFPKRIAHDRHTAAALRHKHRTLERPLAFRLEICTAVIKGERFDSERKIVLGRHLHAIGPILAGSEPFTMARPAAKSARASGASARNAVVVCFVAPFGSS